MSGDETHTVTADAMKNGKVVLKPGGRYFKEVSIRVIDGWACSCGAEFGDEAAAREHVREQL